MAACTAANIRHHDLHSGESFHGAQSNRQGPNLRIARGCHRPVDASGRAADRPDRRVWRQLYGPGQCICARLRQSAGASDIPHAALLRAAPITSTHWRRSWMCPSRTSRSAARSAARTTAPCASILSTRPAPRLCAARGCNMRSTSSSASARSRRSSPMRRRLLRRATCLRSPSAAMTPASINRPVEALRRGGGRHSCRNSNELPNWIGCSHRAIRRSASWPSMARSRRR